jgi:very-short-patch-repair endonuclease
VDKNATIMRLFESCFELKLYHKGRSPLGIHSQNKTKSKVIKVDHENIENNFFPCWNCGIPIATIINKPHARLFCPECKEEYESTKENNLKKYIKLKTEIMFERALRMLEKQFVNMYNYIDAAEVVRNFALEHPERFGSSHEMVAAMELIRQEIKIKTQHKILNHRVDFLLPDLKVILEIDGYMHQHRKIKDSKRDIKIRNELGHDWEIVRIPTKYIEQNITALLEAIKGVYKYKQEIRSKNNGVIPDWYSDREKNHYAKLLGSK